MIKTKTHTEKRKETREQQERQTTKREQLKRNKIARQQEGQQGVKRDIKSKGDRRNDREHSTRKRSRQQGAQRDIKARRDRQQREREISVHGERYLKSITRETFEERENKME